MSSSSSTSPQWEYEVFVSFRGKDVRKTFISYLSNWLNQVGINHFYDEEPEHTGSKIADKIFPAISQARFALVILSENYADSKWCLNELVEILKCRKNHPEVIPVFFNGVDPADVKCLTNKFGEAFQRLCEKGQNDQQIQKWKEALQEVKKFLGFEYKNYRKEADLLDEIVRSLYTKIYPMQSLNFVEKAIGADRLANDVISLLKIYPKDVRMIGISGTERVGKTMVAIAVCKGTLEEFDYFIFLDEVGEADKLDIRGLQQKLLQNLMKMNGQTLPADSSRGYIKMIKNHLIRKKTLLVLDGVTKKEQIEHLGVGKPKDFHPGSRILITTRDRKLLNNLNVDDKYIVEGLNRDEAFRLFCRHAFETEEPKEGYEELSRYLAHYAGGHPLALDIWGSFLKGKSKKDWQELSGKLKENPDLSSIVADLEYPFKVVGTCGDDRSTETGKGEGNVREIVVGSDSKGIKFISIIYDQTGREPVTLGTKGDRESLRVDKIVLDYGSEYLTSISGHTKEVSGSTILDSLTFHTNEKKHGPIGKKNDGKKKDGRTFSFPYTGGKIVGFRWSCNGSYLESIGAFYEPIPHTPIGYSGKVFGPFGGAGEKSWDLDDINGIYVRYASFIFKIEFKVHDSISSKPRTSYTENRMDDMFEVKLRNGEHITSFSGYFTYTCDGGTLINSLTFRTNRRILGPIGREEGKHFSSPSEAGKVIRFFGRTDDHLETIGAEAERYSDKLYPFESVGLFGSSGGSFWDDGNKHANVRKIIVQPSEKFIRSITFYYEVNNERPWEVKGHPDISAGDACTIKIDDPSEYLTSMSGYYTNGGITSLMFQTNKKLSKLIGCEMGMHFSFPTTGGKIVGFYGRSGKNLEAIGAYFEPILDLFPVKSIGPFGGSSGEPWIDKFKGVKEIEVKHHDGIYNIKFVYDGSAQGRLVTYSGCMGGHKPKDEVTPVKLDYPLEYLTSISGYAQEDGAIQSLTFYSNKSTYGPYGTETKKYFWYPSTGSKIIGFYGRGDDRTLNSIGVYAEPIPRMYRFIYEGPLGGFGGTPWDDGVHTDVRGFRISFGNAIKAIGIAYDNNGSFVSGSEHGVGYKNNGSFVLGLKPGRESKRKYVEVLFDYPKERLISIHVWVVEGDGNPDQTIVHDLEIYTTKDSYGPFIRKSQSKRDRLPALPIPSESNVGKIVGFFGTVGTCLNSIGARLEPY